MSKIEEWRLGNVIKDGTTLVAKGKIPRDIYPITAEHPVATGR
jgi:hypothetical protein